MLGVFQKMLQALGVKKAPEGDPTPGADDDFVARHGDSYGEAPDPLSKEVRFEAERQKVYRRKH